MAFSDRYDRSREEPELFPEEALWEDEQDYREYERAREYEESRRAGAATGRNVAGQGRNAAGTAGSAAGRMGGNAGTRRENASAGAPGGNRGSRADRGTPGYGRGRNVSLEDRTGASGERKQDGRGAGRPDNPDNPGVRPEERAKPAGDHGNGGENPGGKRRRGGIFRVLLCFLLVVVIAGAAIAGFVFFKMRNVLQIQKVNSVDLEEQLRDGISNKVKQNEYMRGYRNIALFGVDSRSGDLLEGDNRSDTIMICSIHEETGEIRLVSVFRDTMLDVGDGYYTKANAAYALGGPAQAINMLNRNFDMDIVDFVTVGFEGLAHTIDALGGIEVEIDEEERGYINMYLHDMHAELGTDKDPVEETGLVSLTGIQATAYSRIRYTAGDDFKRAERQRTVLKKTLEKAKNASPVTLVGVVNDVAGDMATSLSSSELLSLIMMATKLELAETGGLPQEEYRSLSSSYEDGEFILPMYLSDNVRWLHEFLFGEENYETSDEVNAINDYLMNHYWPTY